jgi:hypothetical protein
LLRVAAITAFGMLALLALLVLGACKSHDQLVIDTICPTACRCVDPEFQPFCEDECREDLEPSEVAQECFDCYLEEKDSSCFVLEQRCAPKCSVEPPVDAPDPIFVDAPFPVPF